MGLPRGYHSGRIARCVAIVRITHFSGAQVAPDCSERTGYEKPTNEGGFGPRFVGFSGTVR